MSVCVCGRGLKSTVWEGGVRGAGFIWSPMLRRSQYTSHHLMHITDWLPTLTHAVANNSSHFRLPTGLDGVDQWEVLSDNLNVSQRNEILHNIDPHANASALRVGDMKLVFASHGSSRHYDGWYPTPEGRRDEDGTVLEGPFVPYDPYMEGDLNTRMLRTSKELNFTDKESLHFSRTNTGPEFSYSPVVRPPYLSEVATPRHSEVASLLEKIGRKPVYRHEPLVVKCGPRPRNATSSCQPWLRACLFNVTSDPCEYENLALTRPLVLSALQKRLQFYNESAVPPLNKPVDDAGLPYHHDWNWVPWRKSASQSGGRD